MKKLLSLLLAILTVLSLCTFAVAEEEPYTITYISSDSASTGKMMAFEEVVAMYKELHPNFNMEIEYIPERSAFLQKIKILGANDELPDVLLKWIQTAKFPPMAKQSLPHPLR